MNAPSTVWQGARRRIHMQEVGLRDGLQMGKAFVPTEDKISLCNALRLPPVCPKIEVTSFTSPTAIPALKDAEIVMREITRRPGTVYTALVPNLRGAERAIESRTDANLVMSVSATHNLANLRMTQEQSFAALCAGGGPGTGRQGGGNVSLSCVFGCPMEGDVPEATCTAGCSVLWTWACAASRCATPPAWLTPLRCTGSRQRRARAGRGEFTLHFHNTRPGMGSANVLAAIDAGADRFDASLGGLGGGPDAPGASGNVCSEEIVHALDRMGYGTGVRPCRRQRRSSCLHLIGHDIPSQIAKAGPRLALHPVPADFEAIRERALAQMRASLHSYITPGDKSHDISNDAVPPHLYRRRAVLRCFGCGRAGQIPLQAHHPVVPQAAGGANDAIARVVAQKLGDKLGQSVIVENRHGAGGNTGHRRRAGSQRRLHPAADGRQCPCDWPCAIQEPRL